MIHILEMLSADRVYVTGDMANTNPCYWVRKKSSRPPELGGELGIDLPGLETMTTISKAVFYVGIGSALIVTSMFAWRLIDLFLGE